MNSNEIISTALRSLKHAADDFAALTEGADDVATREALHTVMDELWDRIHALRALREKYGHEW